MILYFPYLLDAFPFGVISKSYPIIKKAQINWDLWPREKTIPVHSNRYSPINDNKTAIQDHTKSLKDIHGREMRHEKQKVMILSL